MAGFFDSVAQQDDIKIAETPVADEQAVETAETASVSAFFAIPAVEESSQDLIIIEDSEAEGIETPVVEAPAPAFAPAQAGVTTDDVEADAASIILEAIAKMTALRDRSATKRDAIMSEVEDINAQIATLKERAKERTNSAKDIAAEMKKVEESIAVLQAQKLA